VFLHIEYFDDASHYIFTRRIEPNSRTTLIDEQSNPSQLVHQEDVMSRHRNLLYIYSDLNFSIKLDHILILTRTLAYDR